MVNLTEIRNSIIAKKDLTWDNRIAEIGQEYKGKVIFSSSFSIEDQIITHIIASQKLDITIFTLDTGRMFDETYEVWQQTKNKYGINIIPYYPNQDALKEFVENEGINSFYDSKENRLECCGIRKIEPLKRALKSFDIWISGVRSAQSAFREDKEISEICIVADSQNPVSPCGGCRQKLAEFSKTSTQVHLANLDGILECHNLGELLPQAFSSHHLSDK